MVGVVEAPTTTREYEREYDSDSFDSWEEQEQFMCSQSFLYFVMTYCMIYDPKKLDWIPFKLWGSQVGVAKAFTIHKLIAVLKARQLGLTWLVLCYALWLMLFRPIAHILIFNRREKEAHYLLGEERLRGIYDNLPVFLQTQSEDRSNVSFWRLSNGSTARAFPTTAGDSYTGTLAIVDEADFVDDLGRLLRGVKPTVEAGGQLILISTSNKKKPLSAFKAIIRSALAKTGGYFGIFLPWWAHPGRDQSWYEKEKQSYLDQGQGLDGLKANYPATPEEAMDPSSEDKRLLAEWVNQCLADDTDTIDLLPEEAPQMPGLMVYETPIKFHTYVIGSDCAEGLPHSDDSVSTVIDVKTGKQVCRLSGKMTPAVHAAYTLELARYYNNAKLMPENNNHGHTFIQEIQNAGGKSFLLKGHGGKLGWSSTTLGKVIMYNDTAETCRNGEVTIYDTLTSTQLKSIEKGTLRAPENQMDDHADAFALAVVGRALAIGKQGVPFGMEEFEI